MNESKHTQGPWKRRSIPGHLFEITDSTGNPVVRIRGGMMPTLDDAILLAAAPDLLEACKSALGLAWEVGCESDDGVLTLLDDSRGDLFRKLSAAIQKATPAQEISE